MEGDFLAGQAFEFGDELAFAARRGEAAVPVGAEVGEAGGGVGEQSETPVLVAGSPPDTLAPFP